MVGLNPTEDFAEANLSGINFSGAALGVRIYTVPTAVSILVWT